MDLLIIVFYNLWVISFGLKLNNLSFKEKINCVERFWFLLYQKSNPRKKNQITESRKGNQKKRKRKKTKTKTRTKKKPVLPDIKKKDNPEKPTGLVLVSNFPSTKAIRYNQFHALKPVLATVKAVYGLIPTPISVVITEYVRMFAMCTGPFLLLGLSMEHSMMVLGFMLLRT